MKTFEFVYKVVASGEDMAEAEAEALTMVAEAAQKARLEAVEANLIEDTED